MNDKELPEDIIANLDQFSTHAENLSRVIANYYHSLMASHVPYEISRDLTYEFANILWNKILSGKFDEF